MNVWQRGSVRGFCALLGTLVIASALLLAAGVSPLGASGAGNNCDGHDTGAPGQGGDHTPCTTPPTSPPTSPPTIPPTSPPVSPPTSPAPAVPGVPAPVPPPGTVTPVVTPTPVPGAPIVVAGEISIRPISNVLQRAFVAGESVRLAGVLPANCAAPQLHLDGRKLGAVDAGRDSTFDLGVVTQGLSAGQHVAEVVCSSPAATLMRTVFWVAAPQSSSNVFFVALVSVFVIFAIGWVALRSIAGQGLATAAAKRIGARTS